MTERDKKEAFSRLIAKRLPVLAKQIKLFTNLANPYNYEFTSSQLRDTAIEIIAKSGAVNRAYMKYLDPVDKEAIIKAYKAEISFLQGSAKSDDTKLKVATEKIVKTATEGVRESVAPPPLDETDDDSDVPDFLKRKSV